MAASLIHLTRATRLTTLLLNNSVRSSAFVSRSLATLSTASGSNEIPIDRGGGFHGMVRKKGSPAYGYGPSEFESLSSCGGGAANPNVADRNRIEEFKVRPFRRQWGVKSDETTLQIRIDMPGLSKDDVKIALEEETNKLIIKGGIDEKEDVNDSVKFDDSDEHLTGGSHSKSWGTDNFDETGGCRYFSKIELLPTQYKIEEIKAEIKNGVLMIKVPKIVRNVKQIEVE